MGAVLVVPRPLADQMVAHCLAGLPDEGCGLLGGDAELEEVSLVYPSLNVAASSLVYEIDPKTHLRADRDVEEKGATILGVFHSHTHTEAYPSPTDVAQAPDPDWHYVIISLRDTSPAVRSFRIISGEITEEAVELV